MIKHAMPVGRREVVGQQQRNPERGRPDLCVLSVCLFAPLCAQAVASVATVVATVILVLSLVLVLVLLLSLALLRSGCHRH